MFDPHYSSMEPNPKSHNPDEVNETTYHTSTPESRYSLARSKGQMKKSKDMRGNAYVIPIRLGLWLDLEENNTK